MDDYHPKVKEGDSNCVVLKARNTMIFSGVFRRKEKHPGNNNGEPGEH